MTATETESGKATGRRPNPMSDKYDIKGFHHIELWTLDAITLCKRYASPTAASRRRQYSVRFRASSARADVVTSTSDRTAPATPPESVNVNAAEPRGGNTTVCAIASAHRLGRWNGRCAAAGPLLHLQRPADPRTQTLGRMRAGAKA